ncbi:zf-CCHC domain-containing protein, partial [Cephalotus follicularis]
IANYFVGDPTYLKDRTSDQLSNLRYRKLQDFRWYKDTFMTKVLTREDANQPYWKEKFITGLPTLFAKKIKNKYREKHKGVVPYDKLTYGDIVSTITKTGLEICYDIKMSKQIKRESKTYKKELGDFCTQFGYETFKPPPSKNLQKPKIDRKNYYKKQFENPEYYRKPNKRKPHFKTNKFKKSNNDFPKTNSAICYNCGKPGHIAKYCYIRKQIKKLDLTEDHRNQIFKIIDNQSPEEGESDYFSTSSTKIQAIKNSSTENEFSSDNSKIKTCKCNNCIIEKDFEEENFLQNNNFENKNHFEKGNITLKGKKNNYSLNLNNYSLTETISDENNYSFSKRVETKQIQTTPLEIENIKKSLITHEIEKINEQISKEETECFQHLDCDICVLVREVESIKPEIQEEEKFINLIEITIQDSFIQDSFKLQTIDLVDSGAETNCIQEELIPTKFFEKTKQKLSTANGENLKAKFKISDVHICNEGIYIKQSFILVKDNLGIGVILSQSFLEVIKPFKVTNEGITTKLFQQKILFTFNKKSITKEVNLLKTLSMFKEHSINLIRTKEKYLSKIKFKASQIKEKMNSLRNNIINKFCSDLPNAFWHKK